MPRHDNYLGQTIGNYVMLERLGSGGFGSVYLAQNKLVTERVVAIKVINENYVSSPEESQAFLNEARVLLRLQHPYILPIFDIGEHDGIPYIVVELATGSLSSYLKRQQGPLPLDKALLIITQVGQGLSFAHQQHIVHRDLKPDNILFNAKGDAMLADFGISLEVAASTQRNVAVTGTPPYMAPEQFQGITSMLSDQYALGCIAYELLTGQRPFQAGSFTEWAIKHTHETPIPPRQLNPAIPPHVEQAILKAMAKERTERFANVTTFVAALSPQKTLPAVPTRKVLRSPAGQTVLDKTVVTIGRGPDNTYALADAQVSSHHAMIRSEGEEYVIEDRRSMNKTYVNGQVIPPETPHILKPGDVIGIGQTNFEFANEISSPPTVAAPLPTVAAPPPGFVPLPPTMAAPSPKVAPPPPTVAAPLPPTVAAPPPAAAALPPATGGQPSIYESPLGSAYTVSTPPPPRPRRTALWIVLSVVVVFAVIGGIVALIGENGSSSSNSNNNPNSTPAPKTLDINRTYTGSGQFDSGAGFTITSLVFNHEDSSGQIQGVINTVGFGNCTFNNGTVDSQGKISFACPLTSGGNVTFTGTVSSDNSSISGQITTTNGNSGTWSVQ